MAHDVFISYSTEDKAAADAVCAILENNGVRCWIAPRDIMPGADWGESIVRAIREARLLLLVFSTNANKSKQIKREVEVAADSGVTIVPLRIENVAPTESFKYFLGNIHWMDALTPPLERHLHIVAEKVKAILSADPPSDTAQDAPLSKAISDERGSTSSLAKTSGSVKHKVLSRPIIIGFVALLLTIGAAVLMSWPRSPGGVNLGGTWSGNDGATYLIQQKGRKVSWTGGNPPYFENKFEGSITDNGYIDGDWHDLPGYRAFSGGKLTLKIDTPMRLVAVSQTGGFSGTVWNRR